MKTITAQYNWARWIATCPDCEAEGKLSAVEVKPGDIFVCSEHYPDVLAKTLVPNPRMKGALNSVPDEVLREEVRQQAIADGNAYEVIFPEVKKEIEAVLRVRPQGARNWLAGVTVEDLVAENIERAVELEKMNKKDIPVVEEPIIETPIEQPIEELITEPVEGVENA